MKESILEFIGNTPMVRLKGYSIFLKLEYFNLTGSIKDRVAKQILLDAIHEGTLRKGMTIAEATSGNTGIALAAIGRALGFPVLLFMPESMSMERRKLLKGYGAELILTPKEEGMEGATKRLAKLKKSQSNLFIPNQFENPKNILAHYLHTAKEIWDAMEQAVDVVVAGIGTGGTIMGIAQYVKERNASCYIVGVEPKNSPFLTKGYRDTHQIEGIGAGFFPPLLDMAYLDEILPVSDQEAYHLLYELALNEGLFLGPSSCAAIVAAKKIQQRKEFQDKRIAVICPDSISKYISLLK